MEDKTVLCEALNTYGPLISECTFTNLFIWRETNQALLSQIGDTILVKRRNPETNQFFLFPLIGQESVVDVVEEMCSITGGLDFPLYDLDNLQAEF